jgi:hypothetical protein
MLLEMGDIRERGGMVQCCMHLGGAGEWMRWRSAGWRMYRVHGRLIRATCDSRHAHAPDPACLVSEIAGPVHAASEITAPVHAAPELAAPVHAASVCHPL